VDVTHTLCTARSAMIIITYVPLFVTMLFRGMPGIWKGRHRLLLCWLVCMQALFPGQKTLEEGFPIVSEKFFTLGRVPTPYRGSLYLVR